MTEQACPQQTTTYYIEHVPGYIPIESRTVAIWHRPEITHSCNPQKPCCRRQCPLFRPSPRRRRTNPRWSSIFIGLEDLTLGSKLYPPKNREELRRLHEKIEESETDSLKKSCLYYYLLKDFKADSKFAMDAAIPEQFCQLISGFYALDHLQFEVPPNA